jgi:LysR family transcriptional regulator, regulator of gene expression of beta-lactamase
MNLPLKLTDEAQALLPMFTESFGRMSAVLGQFERGRVREPLTPVCAPTLARRLRSRKPTATSP